jgi:hypothetical protein
MVQTVADIPPIWVGISWEGFEVGFFSDEPRTVPLPLTGLPVQSQMVHVQTGRRVTVAVAAGSASNRLKFSLPATAVGNLPIGEYNWNVVVELTPGKPVPIAEGCLSAKISPTLWTT